MPAPAHKVDVRFFTGNRLASLAGLPAGNLRGPLQFAHLTAPAPLWEGALYSERQRPPLPWCPQAMIRSSAAVASLLRCCGASLSSGGGRRAPARPPVAAQGQRSASESASGPQRQRVAGGGESRARCALRPTPASAGLRPQRATPEPACGWLTTRAACGLRRGRKSAAAMYSRYR